MIYSRWSLLPVAVQASAAGQGLGRIYVARFPTPAVTGSQESGRAGAPRKVKVTFRDGSGGEGREGLAEGDGSREHGGALPASPLPHP